MADAVHQRLAPVLRGRVLDRIARANVVDDFCAGVLDEEGLGEERRDEVARDELSSAVEEEAPVGVAVPCDPDVGFVGDDPLGDIPAVLFDERVCLVIRERPVHVEAQRRQRLRGYVREDERRDHAGDAAAGVKNDVEWFED